MDRLNTTPFETQSSRPAPPRREPLRSRTRRGGSLRRRTRRSHRGDSKRTAVAGVSMLIKLGICAGACALVLVLKWIDSPITNGAVETVNTAVTDEVDFDEMLGKLQFVELDGLLSVFGVDRRMAEPIAAESSYLIDDGRKAVFEGKKGEEVAAARDGTVSAVGTDASLGPYVAIRQSGDTQMYYYGLEEIFVENGQPIRKLDTLGTLGEEGKLTISVLKQGRPQDPGEYFTIGGTQK